MAWKQIYNGPLEAFLDEVNTITHGDAALKSIHINARLSIAIKNGNVDETRQIITEHNVNINQTLASRMTLPGFTKHASSFIPLHRAIRCHQTNIVRLLINELNADITIKDKKGQNALHCCTYLADTDLEIVQLLMSKDNTLNSADNDGKKPIEHINWLLDKKIENDPEIIKNLQAIKALINNNNPSPQPIPADPTVITDGSFPWKWIGGSIAVAAVVVATKKLYNWWYKVDAQEEKTETDEASIEPQQASVQQ